MNYLYNGREFPDINDFWTDKESYPRACIIQGLGFYNAEFHSGENKIVVYSNAQFTYAETETVCYASKRESDEQWSTTAYTERIGGDTQYATVIWSNYDIYNEDGTLYLSASEPVPVVTYDGVDLNRTSYLLGRLFGRRIKAQRKPMKPIAYLYNGVRLPKLPEWDREIYPYAAIAVKSNGDYLFFYKDTAITVDANGAPSITSTARSYATRTQWTDFVKDYSSAVRIVWANSDIYTTDGTLFLASSDPVPTYENAIYDSDYSYNGVVFPKLPEWDKATYPYAFIVDGVLYVTGGLPSYKTADEYVYWPVRGDNDTAARATRNKMNTQWSNLSKITPSANVKAGVLYWSNVDIHDENNNLVIGATEPIPVYE